MANQSRPQSIVLKLLLTGAVVLAVYFGNVALQTHLGEKALAAVDLEQHSLTEALQIAERENKRVLADLSAIWCPTCRALDKNVFSDARVQEAVNADYVFARIEYESEEGAEFMRRYEVTGFPTLLVLAPSGEKLRRLKTTTDPVAFVAQL